jgi:rubredoxin
VLGLEAWIRWLVAALIFLGIAGLGLVFIRGIASGREKEKIEPEDVTDLDVFFVCRECGTEFQVTKLGEVQVPRHCGEPMSVVRRPRQQTVGTD